MRNQIRIGLQINATDSDYAKGIIHGVEAWCRERQVALVIFSGRSFGWPYGFAYQNSAIYSHIHRGNVDALVIVSGTQCNFISNEEFTEYLESLKPLPLVSLTIPIPGTPSIVLDNDTGLRNLLAHLVDVHGCKRIAIMKGPEDNDEACKRFEVYKEYLAQRDLPLEPELCLFGDFSAEYSLVSLKRHVAAKGIDFDALVCLNDTMAIGCLQYFRETGVRIPEDLIVTGFDDVYRSRFESPTLTTVSQDFYSQGRLAAEHAYALASGKNDLPEVVTMKSTPVYRQSCGCISPTSCDYESINEAGEKVAFSRKFFLDAGLDRFRIQDDIINLRNYLSRLIAVLSLHDLVDDLRQSLESFDIRSCAIVLFRSELINRPADAFRLPKEAEIILKYDEETPRDERFKPIRFNPRESLFPANTFSARSREWVAISLYYRENQLGYIMYEPGDCDPSVYETLCVQLSTTIRSALVFAEKQAAEERLNDALYDLERSNKKLSDISKTDELTGLYNRRGFISLGQQTIDLSLRMGKNGLVVFCDMDGLKAINDTWGHEAGDRAIVAMGVALKKIFRNLDIVARLGGDEFAIVAADINSAFVATLRERLGKVLRVYNETSGENFELSLSLGAVEFTGSENNNLEKLLSSADSFLYEEKRQKKEAKRLQKDQG